MAFTSKVWRCLERPGAQTDRLTCRDWETTARILATLRQSMVLAEDDVVRAIHERNPETIRIGDRAGAGHALLAMLPLNAAGFDAMVSGTFDGLRPDPAWICSPKGRPEALYIWLVYMPGRFGSLLGAIADAINPWLDRPCPLFSRATTAHAERLHKGAGFLRAADLYPDAGSDMLVALPERTGMPAAPRQMDIGIARTMEDIMQVFAVRSATYMAEQFCHYAEEFDGNDFCATHFIGRISGDAAGCIRVRFFDGFAKLERLAVRAEYRNSRLSYRLVRAALDHCRRKGYRRLYGHSRLDLVRFWRVFGFQPLPDRPPFSFANVQYVELALEQPRANDAITIDSGPMIVIRPEGAWDRPGPFDLGLSDGDPARQAMIAARTRTVGRQSITKGA